MKKSILIFVTSVLLLSGFLRLYKIEEIPPGVNRDEASIGYTAYSLLLTAKDEYGRYLPISFESFGDWKLPLYIYSVVPFVAIFGLSELAVRLPSAILGILTVLLTFFLVKELMKDTKYAVLSMLLLAVSPWHLHLSRVESESNMAVFLMVLGILLFLKSVHKKWLIIPSFFCLSLTYYTYAGNYVFTTLITLGILVLFRRSIVENKFKYIGLFIFLFFSGLIFYYTIFSANATKLSGINIFGDPSIVHAKIEIPRNEHDDSSSLIARVFHNRIIFGVQRFVENYLNSYSPQFLFIKGGENNAHNIAGFGNMYLIEAVFFYTGIIYFLVRKKKSEEKLILWWFFVAPIASSITKDAPHTNRLFVFFPMIPFMVSVGIVQIVYVISSKYKYIGIGLISALFFLNMGIYLDRYYVHFPQNEANSWGIGYKNVTEYLTRPENMQKPVIMSHPEYSPYSYLLFYSRYSPELYQQEAQRYPYTNDKFLHVKKYGRFTFRDIEWPKDRERENTLIIDYIDYPKDSRLTIPTQGEIIFANNKPIFIIYKTQ